MTNWLAPLEIARASRRALKPLGAGAVLPLGLAVHLIACEKDAPEAPSLAGAIGSLVPRPATPVIVEAEAGTTGAGVQVVTDAADASITYVTASMNVVDPPVDATDPRVVTVEQTFSDAGTYQMYARVRIGPGGGMDDSFFVDTGVDAPAWTLFNSLAGFSVPGQMGYREGAVIDDIRGQGTTGAWMWVLLEDAVYTVPEGQLTRTISFATREDGLEIDKLAFSIMGEGYATGYTAEQLEAGEPGVIVYPPELPPPFEPPLDQPPLAVGASKWLGMVCCNNQRPFLENYFNQVTPENAGKWGSVEGTRDEYNWTALDEALAVAQANGFPFRFHVLVWGSQQPPWIAALPPEEQLEEIREWFQAVADRYGDQLDLIEVVNEFDNQPPNADNEGNYIEALGGAGESGFDWVLTAFRMAREIFPPSAQLMLNEYSVLNTDERTGRYVELVETLQAEGLINGIGVQGHAFSTGGPVEQQVANLDRLGATGLPIYITEMDVDGPPLVQLATFQRIFPAFWEHPSVAGITLWGYREGMWREPQEATLVYPNGAEKPALRWLKGYLRGTTPQIEGPTTATVAAGYAPRTELAAFEARDPAGAPYPEGTEISWGVLPRTGVPEDASHAVIFDAAGRLRLVGATLAAGTYSVRIFADADTTVSDLFDVQIVVQ